MKRNTLTTAVLAGLTGLAGMVSVSNAVNVNPDGLGQVLLYPYYTTRGGNDTLISIVNTTDRGKAVKIRFIEALNSREVYDFNIYMSAWDVWTAAVTDGANGGARFLTTDTTCTVPRYFGNPQFAQGPGLFGDDFTNVLYSIANLTADGGPAGMDRTRSGYIEVIEMGVLGVDQVNNQDVEAAAEHRTSGPNRGLPPLSGTSGSNTDVQCGLFLERWIDSAFENGNGIWREVNSSRGIEAPSGGLFGNASIINNERGTLLSYEAVAIDNFWDPTQGVVHTRPEDVTPALNSTLADTSVVFISGMTNPEVAQWNNPIDAVNHVLALETLSNEYNVNPGLAAETEWVVTFPTKRFHVDAALDGPQEGATAARAPFTDLWTNASPSSCDTMNINVWDREEQNVTFAPDSGAVCPSPQIPGVPCNTEEGIVFEFCREANVVRFGPADEALPAESGIFGEPSADAVANAYAYINFPLPTGGYPWLEGWARISFADFQSVGAEDGRVFTGLPAIGFGATTFTNDNISEGVLANYGGSFRHRGSRAPMVTPSP